MNNNEELYENYVTNQLGHVHKGDYPLMARYFRKNYMRFLTSSNERILDVGCGMGHFLFFLKISGFTDVTAIDLSQECLEHCRQMELLPAQKIHRVEMDVFLGGKRECFDVIVLNDVLEHLPKDTILTNLHTAREALRPGGRVIIKVVNASNPITGGGSRYIDFTHTVGFTEESLAQVLRMAGYRQVQVLPQDIWVFNPLVNAVGKFLQGLMGLLFRAMNMLYGRKTTKIFTKDLIAAGYR